MKKIKHSNSLEGYIERYGKSQGEKKWKETKARKKNSKTLKRFQEIYGEEEGKKRRNDYLKQLKLLNSLQGYLTRYGEIEGLAKWRELTRKKIKNSNHVYSKISQELFYQLLKSIRDKDNVYFYEHNGEYPILYFFVDFLYNFKIIEFYEDIWHANPLIFKEWQTPNPFNNLKSEEIWSNDAKRIAAIQNLGYTIKIVWEKDYNDDPEKIIEECIFFLKEGLNNESSIYFE